MPRKPLKKLQKKPEIQPWKIQILRDGLYPDDTGFEGLKFYYDCGRSEDEKFKLYQSIKKDFLQDWISKNPCTRPWAWYEYSAPRWDDPWPDYFCHKTFAEPRLHISGGAECKYNFVPSYYKAVSEHWHFTDQDLPMFESEAAYLQRLNLLRKEEKAHLEKHPELLEPQSIVDIIPGVTSEMYI